MQHSSVGAEQFAIYYVEAFDWSIATNDAWLIAQISGPSCSTCARIRNFFDDLHGKGEILVGGRMRISSVSVVHGTFRYKSQIVIQVIASQAAETRKGPSTSPSVVSKAEQSVSLVFLDWIGSGWQVVEVAAP